MTVDGLEGEVDPIEGIEFAACHLAVEMRGKIC